MLDTGALAPLVVLALIGTLCVMAGAFLVALHVVRTARRLAAAGRDDLRQARAKSQAAQSRTAHALAVTQTARARSESDHERLVRLAAEAAVRARGQWQNKEAADGS